MSSTKPSSLQELIDSLPNLVNYLYNNAHGPHPMHDEARTPVQREYTNWRSEQQAWHSTAILLNQTHHMPELYISGPDARKLLTHLGVNSMDNLAPGVGKQYICCNPRGEMIADCILYALEDESYELVSGQTLVNWVHFNAEHGNWDVTIERDPITADNPGGRRKFRYQIDGPNAAEIFSRLIEGPIPELKFFRTSQVKIAGVDVVVLRHSMSGHMGVEISGPADREAVVRAAILEAGHDLGLLLGGHRAYFTAAIESGWMGYPVPAIYTHDDMKAFREWLPADGWEANYQIGGSFVSDNIEDYYVTPYDHGYDHIVKFDHEFIGREALERLADNPPRTKVTLVWNEEDVQRVVGSLLEEGAPYKYIDMPLVSYAQQFNDRVLAPGDDDVTIGCAIYSAYSYNERALASLALIDRKYAEPGTEVSFVWGEPDGGSRKPIVETPHRQTTIRATVAPVPFGKNVQQTKHAVVKN